MVVLASSICTKGGKALVSRQFVEMPRARIEGLLVSFPKLMVPGQQHTTIETEAIRYVYQPVGEDMYAVLITSRQNNIVQDMDTLHLIARAVSDICDICDQQDVIMHGFEILSAFDEMISQGYRDNIDLSKLRTIMEMESHEEKIQEIIERNKEREAKQELKRKAKMFEQQRRDAAKRGLAEPGLGGIGSGGSGSMLSGGGINESYEPLLSREPEPARSFSPPTPATSSYTSTARGMRLGRKPKGADILGAMKSEVEEVQRLTENLNIEEEAIEEEPAAPAIDMKGVHVQIEDHITAIVNRDGGLEQMEVKGDLSLIISDSAYAQCQLSVVANDQHGAQFKTHPKINKKLFQSNSVIALKDPSGSYPISQPISVLKWRIVSGEEDDIPLTINCWPSPSANGTIDVNIEYELTNEKLELENVIVSIPLPHGAHPTVGSIDGIYEINRARSTFEWQIPTIDASNKSGSLDFNVPGSDAGAFFPVIVGFTCSNTYCDIEIQSVNTADNQPIEYSKSASLIPDQYAII